MRLSNSSFAGTARTLVAVGMVSEMSMFLAMAAAAPRSGLTSSPSLTTSPGLVSALAATGFASVVAGAGFAAGLAGAAVVAAGAAAALGAGWLWATGRAWPLVSVGREGVGGAVVVVDFVVLATVAVFAAPVSLFVSPAALFATRCVGL